VNNLPLFPPKLPLPGAKRVALVIAIVYTAYDQRKFSLPGAKHDGIRMAGYLERKGYQVTFMTDFPYCTEYRHATKTECDAAAAESCWKKNNRGDALFPSKANIETQTKKLVKSLNRGDVSWFQYAGHGTRLAAGVPVATLTSLSRLWRNGDESDSKVECLAPADFSHVRFSQMIPKYWFKQEYVNKLPEGTENMVFIDCCHSGSLMGIKYNLDLAKGRWVNAKGPDKGKVAAHDFPTDRGMCLYLSGCDDLEKAQESTWMSGGRVSKRGGALTFAFLECLRHGDSVPLNILLEFVREKVKVRGQVPQLCCTHTIPESKPLDQCWNGDTSYRR